ncbi:hypothetical protein WMF28_26395 [Sorangium sp. So ce590]
MTEIRARRLARAAAPLGSQTAEHAENRLVPVVYAASCIGR